MSLVFPRREVAEGPTVVFNGRQVSGPPPAYVGVPVYLHPCEEKENRKNLFILERRNCSEEVKSESSIERQSSLSLSSSTVEDEGRGDDDEEHEEVQSEFKKGSLGCMSSLEDSLPIKRGLSNFFNGKSKSFASLSDAATVEDLAKPENSFNKRRRILMASKSPWSRISSYSSLARVLLPPPEEEEEEEERNRGGLDFQRVPSLPLHARKLRSFRSPRSFSLTDLKHA